MSEVSAITRKHRLVGNKNQSKLRTEIDIGGPQVR